MKFLAALTLSAFACTAFGAQDKDTMCVKQKDGTYKCVASGKAEKEACCQTPSNEPSPAPKPKK